MDRTTQFLLLLIAALVAVVTVSQIMIRVNRHDLSPEEKIERGIYDPDAVVFATIEYDTELNNGRLLDPDSPGLRDLAFLIEGYANYPDRVAAERALPRVRASYAAVDQAFYIGVPLAQVKDLSQEQLALIRRIADAYLKAADRDNKHCMENLSVSGRSGQEQVEIPAVANCP